MGNTLDCACNQRKETEKEVYYTNREISLNVNEFMPCKASVIKLMEKIIVDTTVQNDIDVGDDDDNDNDNEEEMVMQREHEEENKKEMIVKASRKRSLNISERSVNKEEIEKNDNCNDMNIHNENINNDNNNNENHMNNNNNEMNIHNDNNAYITNDININEMNKITEDTPNTPLNNNETPNTPINKDNKDDNNTPINNDNNNESNTPVNNDNKDENNTPINEEVPINNYIIINNDTPINNGNIKINDNTDNINNNNNNDNEQHDINNKENLSNINISNIAINDAPLNNENEISNINKPNILQNSPLKSEHLPNNTNTNEDQGNNSIPKLRFESDDLTLNLLLNSIERQEEDQTEQLETNLQPPLTPLKHQPNRARSSSVDIITLNEDKLSRITKQINSLMQQAHRKPSIPSLIQKQPSTNVNKPQTSRNSKHLNTHSHIQNSHPKRSKQAQNKRSRTSRQSFTFLHHHFSCNKKSNCNCQLLYPSTGSGASLEKRINGQIINTSHSEVPLNI